VRFYAISAVCGDCAGNVRAEPIGYARREISKFDAYPLGISKVSVCKSPATAAGGSVDLECR
jgi:hypothetical protein